MTPLVGQRNLPVGKRGSERGQKPGGSAGNLTNQKNDDEFADKSKICAKYLTGRESYVILCKILFGSGESERENRQHTYLNAVKGMSRYRVWHRELPAGARQRRQILKVLPEQPDQGRKPV